MCIELIVLAAHSIDLNHRIKIDTNLRFERMIDRALSSTIIRAIHSALVPALSDCVQAADGCSPSAHPSKCVTIITVPSYRRRDQTNATPITADIP